MNCLYKHLFINILIYTFLFVLLRYIYIKCNKIKINKYHEIILVAFFISIISILTITGLTNFSEFEFKINGKIYLTPFNTIFTFLYIPDKFFVLLNILGNIILFTPIGFFLPLLWKRFKSFKVILINSAMFSLFIEICQLFLKREADIDDIILNTLGGILGYAIFILLLNKHYIKYNKIVNVRKE